MEGPENEGYKLLKVIRSIYVNSLACVRVKESESQFFIIDNDVPLTSQCVHECGNESSENKDGGTGSEVFLLGDRMEITWPLVC